jgi:hypothetical protein
MMYLIVLLKTGQLFLGFGRTKEHGGRILTTGNCYVVVVVNVF